MTATAAAPGPVLVGVDGSTHNASAVAWAAAEALSSPAAAPLVLVHDGSRTGAAAGRAILGRAVAEARRLAPGLATRVELVEGGGAGQSLLEACAGRTGWPWSGAATLVVGRRGSGATRRVRLGTTARHLVREPGPLTVVVPDGWSAAEAGSDAPVVLDTPVGGDVPAEVQDAVLGMALERAQRLGRRVVAVASWSVPAQASAADRRIRDVWREHAERADRALQQLLAPWVAAYPGVEVVGMPTDRHPVAALLEQAEGAELVVLPRGDRACAVVEYADRPVAVGPLPDRPATSGARFLADRRHGLHAS